MVSTTWSRPLGLGKSKTKAARWSSILAVVLCGVLACGCGGGATEEGGAGAPADSPSATSAGAAGEQIRDDFSDPTSGWTRSAGDERGADYEQGTYVVWSDNDAAEYVGGAGRYEARELTDSRLEVEATKLSGPPGVPVGLSCRQWNDGEGRGIYFADVDAEGEARIGLYENGDQEILAKVERAGLWHDGMNTLRLDCIGDELRFFVNGDEVLSARSDRFDHGQVGLRAGGGSSGVTRVAFDNALITVF